MAKMLKRLLGMMAIITLVAGVGLFFGLRSPWVLTTAGAWISDRLDRPVEIGQLSLEFYPQPAIALSRVAIGDARGHIGTGEIRNIRLRPGTGWSSGQLVVLLELGTVDLDEDLLVELIDLATTDSGEGEVWLPFSSISIGEMTVPSVRRPHPTAYLLTADLAPRGGCLKTAVLRRLDGHMRLSYSHVDTKSPALLSLVAHDWVPPVGPALHFDNARLSGYLNPKSLDIRKLAVKGYEGTLNGNVRLVWDRNWTLRGSLRGEGIRMAPVIEYYDGGGFDGLLSANVTIRAKARKPGELLNGIHVKGPFVIRKAVIDTRHGPSKHLRIDAIHAKGKVDRWSFKTEDTLVEAYGGELRGVTETRWSGAPSIKGQVKAKGVQLEPILDALMLKRPISGRLSGDSRFVLNAPAFPAIFHHPDLTANLTVEKGVIFETDLENLKEGQTPFNELKARVRMKEGITLLSALGIESERLSAEGWVKVLRDDRLDGKIAVTLQNTISLAGANVGVGGTLDDPSFLPATSTIIGGVIGTGLLGPGWGTALGVRLGQLLDSVTGDESDMEGEVSKGQGMATEAVSR